MRRFRPFSAARFFTCLHLLLLCLLCLSVQAADPQAAADPLASATLIYVSDYFSFVGSDAQGRVAFALDNNRGRDGSRYQAEHFVVLHDERRGWMAVQGNGSYPNVKKELATIPSSAFFQFEGLPRSGMTITSPKNDLTLKISGLPQHIQQDHAGSVTWMGSAPAVLSWQGRTIAGRVIYEYVMMKDFNRLTRTYWGMWKAFQGMYLLAGEGDDVYLHTHESDRIAAMVGKLTGFAVLGNIPEALHDLRIDVLDYDFAPGFYRFPNMWRVTWTGSRGPGTMSLILSYRKSLSNWLIGGFAMGIVTGDLSYGGTTWPIYGLAELIM